MTTTPRDTQFAGFAHLLWMDILYESPNKVVGNSLVRVPLAREEAEAMIAQRAYDLAIHITDHVRGAITRNPHLALQGVPDLTEWTEEEHS